MLRAMLRAVLSVPVSSTAAHQQLLAGCRQWQHLPIWPKGSLKALGHEPYQLPAVQQLLPKPCGDQTHNACQHTNLSSHKQDALSVTE
jgi:hypothetical protein